MLYYLYNADKVAASFTYEMGLITDYTVIEFSLLPFQIRKTSADGFAQWVRERAIDLNTFLHRQLANELIGRANMCFMPDNLEFLRAGGRVSNVAFLGAKLLNLHPVIEILDGLLMATKKYRGKMNKVAAQLVTDFAEKYDLDREECLWLISVIGFSDEVRAVVENAAKEAGFKKIRWIQAGGVITTHGGPAAFGLAGFSRKK